MNRQVVLLIVVALLVVVIWLQRRQQQEFVATEPAGTVTLQPDRVSRLSITRPGEAAVDLVRVGGGWRIQSPFDYAAQDQVVQSVLTQLEDLELTDVVSSNPDNRELFEVDSTGTLVEAWEGPDQVISLVVGKASSDFAHTYVRRTEENEVYRAQGMLTYNFNKKPDDWRDTTILALDPEQIRRIELRYPAAGGSVELARQDSLWTYAKSGGVAAVADSATVANVLSAAARFNTVAFATQAELEGEDRDKPDFTLFVETDAGQHEVHFWKTEDNRYLAILSGNDNVVFSVYENMLTRLQKQAEDFAAKSS